MTTRRTIVLALTAGTLTAVAAADVQTIGSGGIRSQGLTLPGGAPLTGAGIRIGQIEQGRPGVPVGAGIAADPNGEWFIDSNLNGVYNVGEPWFDNNGNGLYTAGWINANSNVRPEGVYVLNADAPRAPFLNAAWAVNGFNANDHNLDAHAQNVAGVMVSGGGLTRGVAPGASLHSGAYVLGGAQAGAYENVLVTLQHVATRNGDDVRAINNSWAKSLRTGVSNNGASLLTLGVDYMAGHHDTLMVFAGPQDTRLGWVPQDIYNGLVVGNAEDDGTGVYRRGHEPAGSFAQPPQVDRRVIDLLAPGTNVATTGFDNRIDFATGTSFAAPHATGTVALLQEYADNRIGAAAPRWDASARDPRVMRAVLVNSADKIAGVHGSTRTVTNNDGTVSWANSPALNNTFMPLDREIGSGMLNAERALSQLTTGEHDSFGVAVVPTKGWDFGTLLGAGDTNKYIFDAALEGGSHIAVTLAWNRVVSLTDTNSNGRYDIGEGFVGSPLNDLDLFLVPKGAASIAQAVMSSRSVVDSIEHMFWQVPAGGGQYEVWVHQWNAPTAGPTQYGLAWWGVAVPAPGTVALLALAGLTAARRRRA